MNFYDVDHSSQTALHKAALQGHLSIIMYLLPGKGDVHARDADGWTALHNACSKVRSALFYRVLHAAHYLYYGRDILML
jgi:ankyrin repeat protein